MKKELIRDHIFNKLKEFSSQEEAELWYNSPNQLLYGYSPLDWLNKGISQGSMQVMLDAIYAFQKAHQ